MAPAAAAASTLAAASSKRPPPASSHADPSSPALPPPQGGGTEHEAAARPAKQRRLQCPRCRSTNTKFCYYNNYSTAQPRHLCRACRRYWTHGGTLRDVPVGAATRRPAAKRCRRAVSAEPPPSSSAPPPAVQQQLPAPDLLSAAGFPFLDDGNYLLPQPQLDPARLFAPAPFSWPSPAVLPGFYDDGFAPPAWDDGTTVAAALGDVIPPAALQFAWPPPPGN